LFANLNKTALFILVLKWLIVGDEVVKAGQGIRIEFQFLQGDAWLPSSGKGCDRSTGVAGAC